MVLSMLTEEMTEEEVINVIAKKAFTGTSR